MEIISINNPFKNIIHIFFQLLRQLVLLLFLSTFIQALAHQALKFGHQTIEDGLSQSTIFTIYQDSQGYMWFGTGEGLNKYNGYEYKIYTPDYSDSLSLSENIIYTIIEDKNHNLWVGTYGGGLNRLDCKQESFTQYRHDPDNSTSIASDYIYTFYKDGQGTLWIGTDGGGLDKYDPDSDSFVHYKHDAENPNSLSDNYVSTIFEDSQGSLWVGSSNGLNRLDNETDLFSPFFHDANDSLSLAYKYINVIFEDRFGWFWLGTDDGLFRLLRDQKKIIRFQFDEKNPNSISSNEVNTILEDKSGKLWIGTENGLDLYDRKTNSFNRFYSDVLDPYSISENTIYSLFEDEGGVLWIGTSSSGLNTLYTDNKPFRHYSTNRFTPNLIADNHVYALIEDGEESLWIGTSNGLTNLNLTSNKSVHYKYSKGQKSSISSNMITKVIMDKSDNVWIGTDYGINKYNPEDESFVRYMPDTITQYYWSANYINEIYEYQDNTFWLGTSKGIYEFDLENNNFSNIQFSKFTDTDLDSNTVNAIIGDSSGRIWIGTEEHGLYLFDQSDNSLIQYQMDPESENSIGSNAVNTIYIDRNENVWIGTYGGGLNYFDPITGNFTRYTVANGLSNNVIYGILEDSNGKLWLSTNRGLSAFNPLTKEFKNYDMKDGLQSNEFNGGAHFLNNENLMYFGGVNGFNSFYPDSINDNPYIPPIVITDLLLFNKSLNPQRYIHDEHSNMEEEELVLSPHDYMLTIKFAALNYSLPTKNQYAYILDGFEEQWTYCENRRTVTYTNLPPGHYTFKVKGSNNDRIWNEIGTSIDITVLPPFWQKWWVRSIVLILIILAIISAFRVRTNVVRKRNIILKQSNEFKEMLIDVITHDIKNPAGVISSMAELMTEKQPDSEEIQLISHASENLLDTIKNATTLVQVTLERDISKKEIDLHIIIQDIVKEIASVFEKAGMHLENNITESLIVKANPIIREVFNNYINNALKYATKGNRVIIDHQQDADTITIRVKDYGTTIPESERKRIFDRKIQLTNEIRNGRGLGLAIVSRIAKAHNAEIGVKPNKPTGNIFYIKIPIG